ncbi:hypothetical protein [Brevibacillus marinus]|uniref:hypothetical protein n=1 Tax=Brevibacillus marinus TaxID=2496837 RepID=UPI000F83FD9A|nr:hypothetical protein [Brevibacillus marinus]
MRKPWKFVLFGALGIFVLSVVLVGLYIKQIGYNNLKIMYTLHTTDQMIVPMEKADNGDGKYLTKSSSPVELLKERMKREGWSYVQHDGAGYFFEKENRRCIVTVKRWYHKHYIYTVEDNAVDLAG